MNFLRPVDHRFPIFAHFMEWGERWEWRVDPETGMWVPRGSEAGARGQHRGVDFDVPVGNVVSAMADGMIVKSRYENAIDNSWGAGLHLIQIVMMQGFDAWWIRYTHLRTTYVTIGQSVKRGQPLAESGKSGNAERPMLHVDLMDAKHGYHPIPWQT